MTTFKAILAGSLLTSATAYAGLLYVELPPEYPASMVENPSAEDGALLLDFIEAELAKSNNKYADRVVILTKEGEALYNREVEYDFGGPHFGDINFIRGDNWDDRVWADVEWHLYEAGGGWGTYWIARDAVFGRPFVYSENGTRNVTIDLIPSWPTDETYVPSLNKIILQEWRVGPGYDEVDSDTDRSYLTRCMLHAFRHEWPATWDHFGGGTVYAGWVEIQTIVADLGDELYFNDLAHYEKRPELVEYQRPSYLYFDNFNTYALSTRLGAFDSEWSDVHPEIIKHRYGAAGYCWWKVLQKKPLYIRYFNDELAKIWDETYPEKPTYQDLFVAAGEAWKNAGPGDEIEGKGFNDWLLEQPILRNDAWAENSCAVSVYKNKGYIFNYRRDNYWTETGWQEREIANNCTDPGCFVRVTKTRWNGLTVVQEFTNLNQGFKEWNITINDDEGMLKFKAEHFIEGNPHIASTAYAVDTAEAYETDEIFGVVTDATNGGGTVSVTKDGAPIGTYPVDKYVFKIPNQGGGLEDGAAEYSISYTPPGRGIRGASAAAVIEKDGGCYFDARHYVDTGDPLADLNFNGIPDEDEQALAEKFVPQIQMHYGNELIPTKVGMMLDPGRGPLVKYEYDMAGKLHIEAVYVPTEEYTMEQIFEDTKPHWHDVWTVWKLVFGPNYGDITPPYWHDNYAQILNNPEYEERGYDEPTVYYNIFKCTGKPVIQFWFYYPFNDWRNDHEGDWEHINVRITSPSLNRAEIDEVIYYLHKKYAKKPGNVVPVADGTHPLVFVGGEWPGGPDTGRCSGASYWRLGNFVNAGEYNTDEEVIDGGTVIDWQWFVEAGYSYERLVRNDRGTNLWWSEFPFGWGRTKGSIHNGSGGWTVQSSPNSAVNHECFESYFTHGYEEYGDSGDGGPVASSRRPGDEAKPVTREEFAPLPSPTAGYRLNPDTGEYLSPNAGFELGGGAGLGVPGLGGDSAGSGTAASVPGVGGPAPAAATAAAVSCSPNPVFSGVATFTFHLERPGHVRLAVYDLAGRKVATVAEGHYEAGDHAASWAADVPTGIYLYRLEAGDRLATRKVVVAK
ncbi:MAG: T9SS type A sorting domain-containing protein [Candidatus Coatesbacteria bacterium]|nr:MAG: T9SS type A sorting domain-containing protein [Candidatus Coatesbacteria bacterium]